MLEAVLECKRGNTVVRQPHYLTTPDLSEYPQTTPP